MIWFHFLTYGKVCPHGCLSQRPQGSSPTFHMVFVCLPSIWPISLWSPQGWKQCLVAFAFVAWHPEILHKCLGSWMEFHQVVRAQWEREAASHVSKKKLISSWGNKRYQRNSRKQKKTKRIKREEKLKNTREITSEAVTFRRIKGVGLLKTVAIPPTPTPTHTHRMENGGPTAEAGQSDLGANNHSQGPREAHPPLPRKLGCKILLVL